MCSLVVCWYPDIQHAPVTPFIAIIVVLRQVYTRQERDVNQRWDELEWISVMLECGDLVSGITVLPSPRHYTRHPPSLAVCHHTHIPEQVLNVDIQAARARKLVELCWLAKIVHCNVAIIKQIIILSAHPQQPPVWWIIKLSRLAPWRNPDV